MKNENIEKNAEEIKDFVKNNKDRVILFLDNKDLCNENKSLEEEIEYDELINQKNVKN